jgi:ubiquinol-cytochrome c reductase cytochrome c subunit
MTSSTVARVGGRFRRHSGLVVLLMGLFVLGGAYAAVAAPTTTDDSASSSIAVRSGQKLFNNGCISCHGRNAQGVQDRGPSLIGVGGASVEFQVGTGRMPLARNEAQAERKPPKYSDEETRQLAAYIQSLGGGPQAPDGDLRSTDRDVIAEGGRIFRLNCSSCHAFGMGGGALSSGKFAPAIEATDKQIYEAMLTGPQNMPVFGDNQLTPDQKTAVISYIQAQRGDQDAGGAGIGRTGPVPEGLVVFLVGIVGLLLASLWIAGKS